MKLDLLVATSRGAIMVRTLVISVDRDNDLGMKTAIRGPVIGRKNVLTAALKLGIADPEESDTNAILGALHQHDALVENIGENDDVEIVVLTGDEKVYALTGPLRLNWRK